MAGEKRIFNKLLPNSSRFVVTADKCHNDKQSHLGVSSADSKANIQRRLLKLAALSFGKFFDTFRLLLSNNRSPHVCLCRSANKKCRK